MFLTGYLKDGVFIFMINDVGRGLGRYLEGLINFRVGFDFPGGEWWWSLFKLKDRFKPINCKGGLRNA